MTYKHIYLPTRSYERGKVPTSDDLDDGQVSINITERRIWVCGLEGMVEVTALDQLIDIWASVILKHHQCRGFS